MSEPSRAELIASIEEQEEFFQQNREAREKAERERNEALDVMHEYVYGGIGRWLEPEAGPMVDLLAKHGRDDGTEKRRG